MVPSLAGCAAVGVGVVELMRWKILVCVRGPSNDAMDVLEAMHHRILMIARARLKMPAPPADLRGHRSSPCLVRLRSYRSRHNCFAGANPNQRSSILEKRGGSSSVQSSLLFFARNGRASELTSGLDDVRLAIDPSHPPPNPNPFDSDYTDRTAVGGWLLAGWLARCLAGLPQTFIRLSATQMGLLARRTTAAAASTSSSGWDWPVLSALGSLLESLNPEMPFDASQPEVDEYLSRCVCLDWIDWFAAGWLLAGWLIPPPVPAGPGTHTDGTSTPGSTPPRCSSRSSSSFPCSSSPTPAWSSRCGRCGGYFCLLTYLLVLEPHCRACEVNATEGSTNRPHNTLLRAGYATSRRGRRCCGRTSCS